ncbi:MAG: hypothetical protein BWX95_02691 [Bacteroidetes bacterium ADurb.Bin141]|jgi:hypothetical protein|nr:MAG: hypothetical protein BWX95_02691 [Bacteroidetes bacterium ADurb.Bin141]HOG59225.1 hypothetical protein [Anaerolineaceae bacterium]HPL43420.1 hypothetical protein [Anaerolineaceae bacterium]
MKIQEKLITRSEVTKYTSTKDDVVNRAKKKSRELLIKAVPALGVVATLVCAYNSEISAR